MDKKGTDPSDNGFIPGYNELSEYVKCGFGLMMGATRWSNQFPSVAGLAVPVASGPLSDYNKVAEQMVVNTQYTFNNILNMESISSTQLGRQPTIECLPELNDIMVDMISEELTRLEAGETLPAPAKEPAVLNIPASAPILANQFPNRGQKVNVASWNKIPETSTISMGNIKMLAARNVERPQVSFKDKVDNSTSTLWQPKITYKPNNLKPLALELINDEDGTPLGYRHPYEIELDQWEPPAELLSSDLGLLEVKPLEATPLTHVQTVEELQALLKHLQGVKELAVDCEHHSYRTYQGILCLLQITTESGGDFLVDTLKLREHLHLLNEVFTHPKIIKVFHGADSDVIWLQRDLGVYVVGMFDTHQAAILLEHHALSLKALLERYLDICLDKQFQLADWRIRPLPEELSRYARSDTHFLLPLWRRMREQLLEKANQQTNLLQASFHKGRIICAKTYVKPVLQENSSLDMYLRSRKTFNNQQMAALKAIYAWRDSIARIEDESIGYVLPNHMLLSIAEKLPREMQGIIACCNPVPPLVRSNLLAIHQMVLSARNMTKAVVSCTEAPVQAHTAPAALFCTHDKLSDFREGLPCYFKNLSGFIRQRRKVERKPYSLEVPPKVSTKFDISSVTKYFASPYDRCRLVKKYQEIVAERNQTE